MAKKKGRFENTFEFPLTKHQEFFRIALEALNRAKALKKLHDRRARKHDLTDANAEYLGRMNGLIELASMVSVVFSALALEAFINHYAHEKLTKSYFENYLDKLDLVSKWIVLPRLTHRRQPDPGSHGMNLLRWLVSLRNSLVHYKSKTKTISKLDWQKDWVNIEDAIKSCDTVQVLMRELKKVDNTVSADWVLTAYDL
jgi:hypothetical protein